MKDLKIRKEIGEDEAYQKVLDELRAKIDIADNQLLEVLSKRMKISDDIGKAKAKQNVAILQSKRWNEILGRMILEGEENGLSEEFILRIYKAIHQESINHQKKVAKDEIRKPLVMVTNEWLLYFLSNYIDLIVIRLYCQKFLLYYNDISMMDSTRFFTNF